MKAQTHPKYYENLKITCACGNVIIAGSTKPELTTELCSNCHPFYTGKQKLIDTTGRVDRFKSLMKKKEEIKEKKETQKKEMKEKKSTASEGTAKKTTKKAKK